MQKIRWKQLQMRHIKLQMFSNEIGAWLPVKKEQIIQKKPLKSRCVACVTKTNNNQLKNL